MYGNKIPDKILGEILRTKMCEYGVEDYTEGANFIGGGNYANPATQRENIAFEKQLNILCHQLNMLMRRTTVLNICQNIFMMGYKINPCKIMIGLWDIGKILKMHSTAFQSNIMNKSIELSYMDQFRNLNSFMK